MKYKQINLDQRTKEWRLWRRTKITATDTAKILGKSPWGTSYSCYMEKIEGKETPINDAMQRGIDLEPAAREFLINQYGINLQPKCFESIQFPFMSVSLDAVNDDNTIGIEIKISGNKTMEKAFDGEIDEIYHIQCQKQMLVMGWDKIKIFFYKDEISNIEHEILRDEEIIKEIIKAETHFWDEYILKMCPPPMTNKDFYNNSDPIANEFANEWIEAYRKEKEAIRERKELEMKLKELADNQSCIFSDANVKHTIIERKGVINWDKVCKAWEISEEEIEKYRKEKTIYNKFSVMSKE